MTELNVYDANQTNDSALSVRVAVRVRPLIGREKVNRCDECIQVIEEDNQVIIGKDRSFTYDYVYSKYAQQSDIWNSVEPLMNANFDGYNSTIFAYGQTGSGKTFTMGSGSNLNILQEEQGIIPRIITRMFETANSKELKNPGYKAEFRLRFLEIYGEEIRDLIEPLGGSTESRVMIRETENGQVQVTGATEEIVASPEDCMQLLEKGTLCRTTGSTLMNAHSSRSHAIFTITMTQHVPIADSQKQPEEDVESPPEKEGTPEEDSRGEGGDVFETRHSYFHFVDLAGSERQKRTQAEGKRLKEGIDINLGLLSLGNVISALGDEKKRGKVHVPYRGSKLTRMLQDSLGGNSRTLMITCVSPADVNFEETLNTLKYANRARNIKNKAVVNRDPSSHAVIELRKQVQILQAEVMRLRGGDSADQSLHLSSLSKDYEKIGEISQRSEVAEAEVLRLTNDMKKMRNQMETLRESMISAQTERDYYRMLCDESSIEVSGKDDSKRSVLEEQLREISELKEKLIHVQEERDSARLKARGSIGSDDKVLLEVARREIEEDTKKLEFLASSKKNSTCDSSDNDRVVKEYDECDDETIMLEGDGTDEAEEAEKQRVFEQRQLHLGSAVRDLTTNISLKEQLVENLHKAKQNHERMKEYYEQKMSQLTEEVRTIQDDRDKLLNELQNLESKSEDKQNSRQMLVKKLKEKDSKLAEWRKKIKEMERFSQMKAKADQQLRQLYTDISNMKRQKVDLIKKMQNERKKYEKEAIERRREILSLKRKSQKDREELRKLGTKKEMQERVMKRRLEEMSAANRRLRLQKGTSASLTQEERKKKAWLSAQIKKLAIKEEKAAKLEKEVEKREKIVEQMEKLHGQRNKFQASLVEPSGSTPNSIRDMLISPQKTINSSKHSCSTTPQRRPLSTEEEQTLYELEERIEACQAQIEYKDHRISDLANDVDAPDDADTEASLTKQIETSSLPEARTLLKILFGMAVTSKKAEQEKVEKMEHYKLQFEESKNTAEEAVDSVRRLKMNYDHQIAQLQRDHEEKLSFYMDYYNDMENTKDKVLEDDTKEKASIVPDSQPQSPTSRTTQRNLVDELSTPESQKTKPPSSPPSTRTKLLLSIAEERNSVLRSQCDDSERKRVEMEHRCSMLEESGKKDQEAILSYQKHIKWLEKQLAEDRKVIIPSPKSAPVTPRGTTLSPEDDNQSKLNINVVVEDSPKLTEHSKTLDSPTSEDAQTNAQKNIFHRLANPSNFTGIHKHRMKEGVKKKEEMRFRSDRIRSRRLKDKRDDRLISKNPQQAKYSSHHRPSTAPAGVRYTSNNRDSSACPPSKLKKLSSVEEILSQIKKDNKAWSSSTRALENVSVENSDAKSVDNEANASDTAQSDKDSRASLDVYTRLAGQYTASSKNKRYLTSSSTSPSDSDRQRRATVRSSDVDNKTGRTSTGSSRLSVSPTHSQNETENNPRSPGVQDVRKVSKEAWGLSMNVQEISNNPMNVDGIKPLEEKNVALQEANKDPLLGDRLVVRVHDDFKEKLHAQHTTVESAEILNEIHVSNDGKENLGTSF